MAMNYNAGQGELKNWLLEETKFDPQHQGKCEVIMSQGNGYLGIRSATEERYVGQTRNCFIAGTFNKAAEDEVTELPNAADVSAIEIYIDGQRFHLEKGEVSHYSRRINLKNGELIREFRWKSPEGKTFDFCFRRFVSLVNIHLIAFSITIHAIDSAAHIEISSGIDAQTSNSGAQHFLEGEKRIYDKRFMELLQHTTESKIDFVFTAAHQFWLDNEPLMLEPVLQMDRRRVLTKSHCDLTIGQILTVEKHVIIHTSRDLAFDVPGYDIQSLRDTALANLRQATNQRFDQLLSESAAEWQRRWQQMEIVIEGNDYDQLVIRFAHYHLQVFTPQHDQRFGIAAKGLSGEGYKGHSFWDTEVFILPWLIYSAPEMAKKLLAYRYGTLDGARKKARDNGYKGAQFPWESALTGEEETPIWGAVDIVTGKSTKIWSGFIEQHITCDITNALWQYYQITGDEAFMEEMGYEIMFDTATFWCSRLEWLEDRQQWGICNVIGPDEYKEHIDNNAFTNYMAHRNITLAIEYYNRLTQTNSAVIERLNAKLDLNENVLIWQERVQRIYLPQPRKEDNVIPQDDTYLQKNVIDLTKYKNQTYVGSLFQDYNLEQVNNIQVSKQADIMVLFLMLEDLFSQEVKLANWHYYEPKTLHDSSLSLSTHSVLANDVGNPELAYDLFNRATHIDMGPSMSTSDHGIHAASIGGIWQCIVYGFCGVRMLGGELRISPRLPKEWQRISFSIYWRGEKLRVSITNDSMTLMRTMQTAAPIHLKVHGNPVVIEGAEVVVNV